MKLSNTRILIALLFIQLSTVNSQESGEFIWTEFNSENHSEPSGPSSVNVQCLCNSTKLQSLEDRIRFQQGKLFVFFNCTVKLVMVLSFYLNN